MNFAKTLPAFLATMLTLAVTAKADETNGQPSRQLLQKGQEDFELFHKAAYMSRALYFHDKYNDSDLSCSRLKKSLGGGSTDCDAFEKDLDAMAIIKHDDKCFAVIRGTRAPTGTGEKNVQAFVDDTMKNFDGNKITDASDRCPVQASYLSSYKNLSGFLIPHLHECEDSCEGFKCPIILTGHSKGGAVAVVAAKEIVKHGVFSSDPYVVTFGAPSPFYENNKCAKTINPDRHFRIVTAKEENNKLVCDPISEHARRKIMISKFFSVKFMDGAKQDTFHQGNTILVTNEGEVARATGDVTCYDYADDELMVLTDGDFAHLTKYGKMKANQPLHNMETYIEHLKEARDGAIEGLNEDRRCTKTWQCHDDLICDYELQKCVQNPDYIEQHINRQQGSWALSATYDWPANIDDLVIRILPRGRTDPESHTNTPCKQASVKSNTFFLNNWSQSVQVVFGKGSCYNFSLLSVQTVDFNPWRQDSAEITLVPKNAPSMQYIDGFEANDTGGCQGRNELGTSNADDVFKCAEKCDKMHNCVSFEYEKNGKRCALSSSCDRPSLTVNTPNSSNFWYLKNVDGYVSHYDTGGCSGRNELGTHNFNTLTQCLAKCDSEDRCVSVEYNKNGKRCALSKTCDRPWRTVNDKNSNNYLYTREIDNYERFDTGGCVGKNQLGQWNFDHIYQCAAACDYFDDCVSFEFAKEGTECNLSTTCSHYRQTVQSENSSNYWYRRKDNKMI